MTSWNSHQGRTKFTWKGLETLTLDACLRPLGWSYGGRLFRRGLDGKMLEITRDPDPRYKMHNSRSLSGPEGEALLQLWFERLRVVRPEFPNNWLESLRLDGARFETIARPVSILPPDQYRALVLQLTEGCAWNRCNFCNLYRGTPFRSKTPPQFIQHTRAMVEYFGEALDWRRGIFLGDANVGALPQPTLVKALSILRREFPAHLKDERGALRHPLGFESVSAFLDTFTGRLRTVEEWRELRQLGLNLLHLGVESGSPEILKLLGKPSQPARVVELVSRLKAGGMAVSLILMLGVGGWQGAEAHERQTVELLRQLPLARGDRVYLSELLIHPDSEYARLGQLQGLDPMSRSDCRQQAERLRQQVSEGPTLSFYDVRQFLYH